MEALLSSWIVFMDWVGLLGLGLLFAVMIFTLSFSGVRKIIKFYSDQEEREDRGVEPWVILLVCGGFIFLSMIVVVAEFSTLYFLPAWRGIQMCFFILSVCIYLLGIVALSWIAGWLDEWLERSHYRKTIERLRDVKILRRRAKANA